MARFRNFIDAAREEYTQREALLLREAGIVGKPTTAQRKAVRQTARASDFSNLAASEGDRHRPASVSYYIKLRSFIWQPPEIEFTNFITARNGEQF
jgi:hypothetical protein